MTNKNMVNKTGFIDFNKGQSKLHYKMNSVPTFNVEEHKITTYNEELEEKEFDPLFWSKISSYNWLGDQYPLLGDKYSSLLGDKYYTSSKYDITDLIYTLDSKGGLWNHGVIPYRIDFHDTELESMVETAIKKYNETIKNVMWIKCPVLCYINDLSKSQNKNKNFTLCSDIMNINLSLNDRILSDYKILPGKHRMNYSSFDNACISFVRDDTDSPWSYVGCQRVENQKISLCKYWPNSHNKIKIGNILHEMTHAVGFGHTHQRWDRKDYLKINKPAKENASYITNYKKISQYTIGGYDFKSIMHYPTGKFYKMQCKDSKNDMLTGKRKKFSENDVKIINSLYHYEAHRRQILFESLI